MKVKASVIPFIPAVIAMLFFRVMSVIGVDESGYFLGMDRMVLSYTVIGIALGIAASEIVKIVFNMPMSVSVTSVIVSFAVCFATGVFFGWYPARKASRLDPIEALRFE